MYVCLYACMYVSNVCNVINGMVWYGLYVCVYVMYVM